MIVKDAVGREILELHTWVGFIFDKKTGEQIEEITGLTKASIEEQWKEYYSHSWHKKRDIRYTMASIREMGDKKHPIYPKE